MDEIGSLAVVNTIIDNPEGGTFRLSGEALPTTGYFVGGRVSALIIEGDPRGYREEIEFFVEYLSTLGADYVGWWLDEDTGKIWVDCSDWFRDYETAERICRGRGEIAFYDIERQRSFEPSPARHGVISGVGQDGKPVIEWDPIPSAPKEA